MATDAGDSAEAAAQKVLRLALSQGEPTPAEKLLRAVEVVHQQYGAPHATDTTAIIRELRQTG